MEHFMKMNFIGNFQEYVNPSWIEYMAQNRGRATPLDAKSIQPAPEEETLEIAAARAGGYLNDIYFYTFTSDMLPFVIPTPTFVVAKHYKWWVTKLLPGNCMPMHIDKHILTEMANPVRYFIPLQDWISGHISLYENTVNTSYKAGDVYSYHDHAALHGAANIGYTTRYVLHITAYD